MICPGCGAEMTAMTLDGHGGTAIVIDTCTACQAFWFDKHESLQLAPASTLKLFSLIGEQKGPPNASLAAPIRCPRCSLRLLDTHDRQRSTPFRYLRCPAEHGRFITFFDFLREKGFIRPLSPKQLQELRNNVQVVNCSNCGAPIDLGKGSACPHCGSPVSMLDLKQAQAVVNQLQTASQPRPIDPALPLELARARKQVEAAFGADRANELWWNDVSDTSLVQAGVNAVLRWLKPSS
jgi:DNA-directed RNA polymerase subunit RPC12/RpoP